MALQNKTTQISSGRSTSVDEAIAAIIADLGGQETGEGCIGATAREVAEKQHMSQGTAQLYLRAEVEKGRYDSGWGWRYSPVMKRNYKTFVYWLKEKEE